MKRSWQTLSDNIDRMVATKRQKGRVSIFKTAHLHAKIWRFFRQGGTDEMNEALKIKLQFYCNDLVSLRKPDIAGFRQVNNLLTTLFHHPFIVKCGFQILQERIRELRKIEKERNKIIQRNYLLVDKQRGVASVDGVMNKIYHLPHELFKTIFTYL